MVCPEPKTKKWKLLSPIQVATASSRISSPSHCRLSGLWRKANPVLKQSESPSTSLHLRVVSGDGPSLLQYNDGEFLTAAIDPRGTTRAATVRRSLGAQVRICRTCRIPSCL